MLIIQLVTILLLIKTLHNTVFDNAGNIHLAMHFYMNCKHSMPFTSFRIEAFSRVKKFIFNISDDYASLIAHGTSVS